MSAATTMYGTVVIEQRGDKLYASLGRLSSIIEAFTEPETGRVELVPGSGGAALQIRDRAERRGGDVGRRCIHTHRQPHDKSVDEAEARLQHARIVIRA